MAEFRRYRGSDLRTLSGGRLRALRRRRTRTPSSEAESLVRADEMGIDSHGVAHLLANAYVPGLRSGQVDPKAQPEVVHQTAATALMDAHGGLGGVATTRAMELAIEKARSERGRASSPSVTAATSARPPTTRCCRSRTACSACR